MTLPLSVGAEVLGPERPATGETSGVEGFGGCGFLSSSCLINSGCLGLSGLNLTDCASACGALRACGGGGKVASAERGPSGALGVSCAELEVEVVEDYSEAKQLTQLSQPRILTS